MPAPRKRAGERQDNRPQRVRKVSAPSTELTVVAEFEQQWPAAPDGICDEAVSLWDSFWACEEQSAALRQRPAQLVVLHRWVAAFDQWTRAMRVVTAEPMVTGSTGQPVANPLMSWVTSREAEMEKCERQLGIGLRNLADLGVSVGNARLTAAELNKMAAGSEASGGRVKAVTAGEGEVLDLFEAVD